MQCACGIRNFDWCAHKIIRIHEGRMACQLGQFQAQGMSDHHIIIIWVKKKKLLHFSLWTLIKKRTREGGEERGREGELGSNTFAGIMRINYDKHMAGRCASEHGVVEISKIFCATQFQFDYAELLHVRFALWCRKSNHYVFIFVQSFAKLFDETEQQKKTKWEMFTNITHHIKYQIKVTNEKIPGTLTE